MNRYDEIYLEIRKRLDGPVAQSNSEMVSMMDVINSVQQELGLYNTLLVKRQERLVKKINRDLGYTRFTPSFVVKKLPRVINIVNSVSDAGEVFVKVLFEDNNELVLTGTSNNVSIYSCTCMNEEINNFVKKYNDVFSINLGSLISFASEYPGMSMEFGQNCTNILDQKIDDGFISYNLNIANPMNSSVSLLSLDDCVIATTHHKKYGKLYDYISFYGEEFLSKCVVNVNELNPFIKDCVLKYLSLNKDEDFTLSL